MITEKAAALIEAQVAATAATLKTQLETPSRKESISPFTQGGFVATGAGSQNKRNKHRRHRVFRIEASDPAAPVASLEGFNDHPEKPDDGRCAACGRSFIGSGTERPRDWQPSAGSWWRGWQCRSARYHSIYSGANFSSSRDTAPQNVHDDGKPHP
jgi:hypothetical protein